MARANRHYLPGYVWHITHRCHKKEFLLKFSKDRKRLIQWLFEAKKRYGLTILNYIVTSNHIHLLVVDTHQDVIPKSIQLIAGRTGQEYNQRKNRKGAFWEDRYHATAVQTDRHLLSCMIYIDLNMVRAGVVKHPSEWEMSGYHEIINPPQRYALIDHVRLGNILGFSDSDRATLICTYKHLLDEALQNNSLHRQEAWTESIAVGSNEFISETKRNLASRAIGRDILNNNGVFELREPSVPYSVHFDRKKNVLRLENTYFWNINNDISTG
ncbi:MAG: transposase [Thermodesulfobacteriota bacterium]|nr:transposase [Thermodesulfobacteriota bacterium]